MAQVMAVHILSSLSLSSLAMKSWQEQIRNTLSDNAQLLQTELIKAPGLIIHSKPQGAMYLMVMIDPNQFDFLQQQQQHDHEHEHEPQQRQETGGGGGGKRTMSSTTITIGTTTPRTPAPATHNTVGEVWCMQLLQEENVFVFPGSCFGLLPNAFCLVVCCTKINLTNCNTTNCCIL